MFALVSPFSKLLSNHRNVAAKFFRRSFSQHGKMSVQRHFQELLPSRIRQNLTNWSWRVPNPLVEIGKAKNMSIYT